MTQSQSWKIVAVLMCLAFALGMMGCAPTNLEGDEQPSASAKTVTISGYKLRPQRIEVSVGTKVTWTNKDKDDHTVTADNGAFDKLLSKGQSFSFVFNKKGTFRYVDRLHGQPGLVGTVVVR